MKLSVELVWNLVVVKTSEEPLLGDRRCELVDAARLAAGGPDGWMEFGGENFSSETE